MTKQTSNKTAPRKIYLAWSGDKSRKIAKLVKRFLEYTLPFAEVFFSETDIAAGQQWRSELHLQLRESDHIAICLTHDAIDSKWMYYEAGAALSSQSQQKRNCIVLLFGVPIRNLPSPLEPFQCTEFTFEDYEKLLFSLHESAGNLGRDFQYIKDHLAQNWKILEENIPSIIKETSESLPSKDEIVSDGLIQILNSTESINKNLSKLLSSLGASANKIHMDRNWTFQMARARAIEEVVMVGTAMSSFSKLELPLIESRGDTKLAYKVLMVDPAFLEKNETVSNWYKTHFQMTDIIERANESLLEIERFCRRYNDKAGKPKAELRVYSKALSVYNMCLVDRNRSDGCLVLELNLMDKKMNPRFFVDGSQRDTEFRYLVSDFLSTWENSNITKTIL